MAIRDKLRTNAASYLQPGEQIQAVFCAQSTSAWFALISFWIIILSNAYRAVIVTDQRILVCQAGRLTQSAVKAVLREVPRSTQSGPPHGLWYQTDALGEKLYIPKRFAKDVTAADEARAVPAA